MRLSRRDAWVFLIAIAAVLHIVLAVRSPTPYGYVFDFYHEGVQTLYTQGRLPVAADCWQCYHPPLFYVLGWPLYAVGKWWRGGPGGLADPALRVLALLPLLSVATTVYFALRLLSFYRTSPRERTIGLALSLCFPCLFISSYGIEADIVLTAIMSAFLYYAVVFFARPTGGAAVRLGLLAGLASATKYSGLLAPAILASVAALHVMAGPKRRQMAGLASLALAVCALVGGWKYVDNLYRYGTPLFANGSAQQGFTLTERPSFAHRYDFVSLKMGDLATLMRRKVPSGPLTALPFYRSVWTSLHAMAWGDMSMFSDPSRHGFSGRPYPRKRINPTLALSVLWLGLVPGALALIGIAVIGVRRLYWPVQVTWWLTWLAYISWVLAQDDWALKTKYLLFLLPPYLLFALVGLRWISHRATVAGQAVVGLLVVLIVLTNLYLLEFAAR